MPNQSPKNTRSRRPRTRDRLGQFSSSRHPDTPPVPPSQHDPPSTPPAKKARTVPSPPRGPLTQRVLDAQMEEAMLSVEGFIQSEFPMKKGTLGYNEALSILKSIRRFRLEELLPVWRRLAQENENERLFDFGRDETRNTRSGGYNTKIVPRLMPIERKMGEGPPEDLRSIQQAVKQAVARTGKQAVVFVCAFGFVRLNIEVVVICSEIFIPQGDFTTTILCMNSKIPDAISDETLGDQEPIATPLCDPKTIIFHGCNTSSDRRQRVMKLEDFDSSRDTWNHTLVPGSSIGNNGYSTGTIGARVVPDRSTKHYKISDEYIITAWHVMNGMKDAIHPGYWILASRLAQALSLSEADESKKAITETLTFNRNCGKFVTGKIGADGHGRREDWALVRLMEPFTSTNASFVGKMSLFGGEGGLSGCATAEIGEIMMKNGCRTKITTGVYLSEECYHYRKNTSEPASPRDETERDIDEWASTVDECKMHITQPEEGRNMFAQSGDSGAAMVVLRGGKYFFAGLLISVLDANENIFGLWIDHKTLFLQMERFTNISWKLHCEDDRSIATGEQEGHEWQDITDDDNGSE